MSSELTDVEFLEEQAELDENGGLPESSARFRKIAVIGGKEENA